MKFFSLADIQAKIDLTTCLNQYIATQKQAYIKTYQNKIIVPTPLQLDFIEQQGDCHIKAAYQHSGKYFVVKCATGFYQNTAKGLVAGDGVYLVLCQQTGQVAAILYDQGWLTTLRTALAALIAVELTPWSTQRVGLIGYGQVAQMIIKLLSVYANKLKPYVWSRSQEKLIEHKQLKFYFNIADDINTILENCDVIITATPSSTAFINRFASFNQHIIGVGADSQFKQEIAPELFAEAAQILVDSPSQAMQYGDSASAIKQQIIEVSQLLPIGQVLSKQLKLIKGNIITDLTGIAAQDLLLANHIHNVLQNA